MNRLSNLALRVFFKVVHGIAERKGSYREGAGTMKRDKHSEIVEQRARKSAP